ncbi:MAG: DUF3892 domain-containing protein [Oscillospiraceae bacterium]|nr:DUF3892 domain-containing protein [Oscillospiraceae bacterium]
MAKKPTKSSASPLNTFSEIPTQKPGAKPITGLQKQAGKVVGYQLSDGQIVEKTAAIQMARQGAIAGVGIATRSGTEYLKSLPDQSGTNNLTNLPTV